jgi:hypothetical protein
MAVIGSIRVRGILQGIRSDFFAWFGRYSFTGNGALIIENPK